MTKEHEERLDALRMTIQLIDKDILNLLEERVTAAKQVGEIKKIYDKPIYVPEVEKKKIEALSASCAYPGLVEAIWPVIMCYTRTVE
jgi:chorismate mutase